MVFKRKKKVEDVVSGVDEVDVGDQPPKPVSKDGVGVEGLSPEVAGVVEYFQKGFSGVYSVPASPSLALSSESCALLLALLVEQRKVVKVLGELLVEVRKV